MKRIQTLKLPKNEVNGIISQCKEYTQDIEDSIFTYSKGDFPFLFDSLNFKIGDSFNITAHRFVDNIDPHDDDNYCKHKDFSMAYLIVLKSTVKGKYRDSPRSNYFFTGGEFIHLNEHEVQMIRFNPKKEHALLVSGEVLCLSVFYRRR